MMLARDAIRQFLSGHHRREINNAALKHASVLILLFPKDGSLHVLLTRRTEDVEHHKGQISFPGGSVDEGDEDIVSTALRETEEEIGLHRDSIQVLGKFDDLEVPSGFTITPIIAFVDALPALSLNKDEVAEVLLVPLSIFLDKTNERMQQMYRMGRMNDVYFYRYGRDEIWGATAAMIRAFLDAMKVAGLLPALDPGTETS